MSEKDWAEKKAEEIVRSDGRLPIYSLGLVKAIAAALRAERALYEKVMEAARKYVAVDGPDRGWEERKRNHERLGRAIDAHDAARKEMGL